jgi:tRNA threonylcarbamoyladenosine biosynthesis protein TsaE
MRLPFLAVRTHSPDETSSLGRTIGDLLRPGEVLLLVGDLGTGKTTFVQGLALGLGIDRRPRSPTFTMVHTYEGGRYPLVHADLYRTDTSTEVYSIGLEELLVPPAVGAVEWGEKATPVVGDDYLELDFTWEDTDDEARTITFIPFGRWQGRMGDLSAAVRSWATPAAGADA